MRRKPEPLDPEIAALLASERAFPSQPEETRRRALTRARAALAGSAGHSLRPGSSRLLRGRPLAGVAVGIAAAVAAWAAVREASREPAPMPGSVDSIQTPATSPSGAETPPAAAPAPIEAPELEEPELALPHRANSAPADAATLGRAASAPQTARADSYDAELRWLDRARAAVARRDFTSALAAIARHEREFPAGKLAEERDALRIKALLSLGRGDEARRAAAAFRRGFPRSALLPRVEEMMHAAP
jgi:type IV secretory pathway VirB10-like protein